MARPQVIKVLKVFSFVLGGIVAVVALLGAILALMFDDQAVKAQASRLMMEKKQRLLVIEGGVSLSFWPRLGLRVGRASLSEKGSEQVFATVERAHLSLGLLPLLHRQLAVGEVELVGLSARLVRLKNGSFNFDDLISQQKDQPPLRFDIESVRLHQGRVEYVDQALSRRLLLTGLDLTSGRLANAAEGKLALDGRFSLERPGLEGDIRLHSHYRYDLDKGDYALDGLDVRSIGNYLGMQGAAASLSTNLFTAGSGRAEAIKLELGVSGGAAERQWEFSASLPKLSVTGEGGMSKTVGLRAKMTGEGNKATAQVDLSDVTFSGERLRAEKFTFLGVGQGAAVHRLSAASPFEVDLAAMVMSLPKLSGQLELNLPQLTVQPLVLALSGSAELDPIKNTFTTALTASHGGTRLSSRLMGKYAGLKLPAMSWTLDVERLDLDKYLKRRPASASRVESQPVDFSFLNELDLSGSARIGNVQYRGVKAANVRMDFRAKDGRLDVSPVQANLYQGSLAGQLALEAKENRIVLNQTLSGIALGAFLRESIRKDVLDGRLNAVLDLTTSGRDTAALIQALAGKASLSISDGVVKGIHLAKSFRDLKSRLILRQDTMQAANPLEKTDFSSLTASFVFTQGIARTQDLALGSPFFRMEGEGQFDLPKQNLDHMVKVSVAAGQGDKELSELKGLTIPVYLSGAYGAPKYRLAFSEIVSALLPVKSGGRDGVSTLSKQESVNQQTGTARRKTPKK